MALFLLLLVLPPGFPLLGAHSGSPADGCHSSPNADLPYHPRQPLQCLYHRATQPNYSSSVDSVCLTPLPLNRLERQESEGEEGEDVCVATCNVTHSGEAHATMSTSPPKYCASKSFLIW